MCIQAFECRKIIQVNVSFIHSLYRVGGLDLCDCSSIASGIFHGPELAVAILRKIQGRGGIN